MRNKIRVASCLLAAAISTAGLLGKVSIAVAGDNDVTIPLATPISGQDAPLADPVVKGYMLAIKHANAAGDLPGHITASVQDDQDKPEVGTTVARKLCGDTDVIGVVGDFASSVNLSTDPVYEDCGLVHVSPTSSNNILTEKGFTTFFRTSSKNSNEVEGSIIWIRKNWTDVKTLSTIDSNEASTKDFTHRIAEAWEAGGGTVLDQVHVISGNNDFRGPLTTMIAKKPDLIFSGLFDTDGGLMVKQARQLGYEGKFFGNDGMVADNFIAVAGPQNAQGVYMANLGYDPTRTPSAESFVKEYQAAYGTSPSTYAANTYDATMAIIMAWKAAGGSKDRAKIRDAVAKSNFLGVSGPISFTDKGDLANPQIGIFRVENGKIEYVGPAS